MFIDIWEKYIVKHFHSKPLENFTTDLLVGILKSQPELLKKFAKEFLEISGTSFSIKTQYKIEKGILDIIIKGHDGIQLTSVAIIENKVEADLGPQQLERYANHLKNKYNDVSEKEKKLFLFTKYIWDEAHKDKINDISFKHFYWYKVARFLEKNDNSALTKEFINFLKYHNMAIETRLTPEIYFSLRNMTNSLTWSINIINSLYERFNKKFGLQSKKDGLSLNDLYMNSDGIYCNNLIDKGYFAFGIYSTNSKFHIHFRSLQEAEEECLKRKFDSNFSRDSEGWSILFEDDIEKYISKNDEDKIEDVLNWFDNIFTKIYNGLADCKIDINFNGLTNKKFSD